MRAMFVNENIKEIFKPKSKDEILKNIKNFKISSYDFKNLYL